MTAARGPGGSSAMNQGERGGLPPATAAELDAATRDLVERDAAVFLHQALSTPVANAVVRAEGCRIHDAAGRSYLDLHGNGVHMDDFETHDERRILPGTGFTVEPGLYFEDFGVRTEINMFRGERDATVTGPCQTDVTALA